MEGSDDLNDCSAKEEDEQVESDLPDSSDDEGILGFDPISLVKPEVNQEEDADYGSEVVFELDYPGISCMETTPRTYICAQCAYSSHYLSHVKRHVMSIHDKVRFPCNLCDHQATTGYHLKKHIKLLHEEVTFTCDECKFTSKKRESLKKHYVKVHGKPLGDLSSHRQLPQNSDTNFKLCDRCDYMTADEVDLKHHMKEEHNQNVEISNTDSKRDSRGIFLRDSGMILNVTENEDGKFCCEMCDYSATLRSSVSRHFRNVHQGLRFPCDVCDYKATRVHHLNRHKERMHSTAIEMY